MTDRPPDRLGEQVSVRVFTVMIADLFHLGHVQFLCNARALGDHLTVGLVNDRRAMSYKRRPVMTYEERKAVLESSRYVDAVIPLDENVTNDFMKKHGFQIRAYAVANDADEDRFFRTLWKDMDRSYFVRIAYTEGISTTDIIARIRNRDDL
jgi:cytidyltransferase-like protein